VKRNLVSKNLVPKKKKGALSKVFYPKEFLRKALPKGFWKKDLLNNKFGIKRECLRAITTAKAINGRKIKASIYRTITEYESKYKSLIDEGLSKSKAYNEAVNEEVLVKQRIENAVLYDEVQELKEEHAGGSYRWLPSSSGKARPQHQLLYGKIFKVGCGDSNGNMPGEDYGCRCGLEFLGKEK
jgi:hypothetical protein